MSNIIYKKSGGTPNIGPAEDGDYTDGLFSDINENTKVGIVVDRFNQVLKALAPKPAPRLTYLGASEAPYSQAMKLSFGRSSEVVDYTNVYDPENVTEVDFSQEFTKDAPPIYHSLGVFSDVQDIYLILNIGVEADVGVINNYNENSFNVPQTGIGTYKLEVNSEEISPFTETTTTASLYSSTFVLSDANPGHFQNGTEFSYFRHREGQVNIPNEKWRIGYNYAKVTHISTLGQHVTFPVAWVYDPHAKNGADADYVLENVSTGSWNISGIKYLSGVKYYTDLSYTFDLTASNYYKNCYPAATNGGITFNNKSHDLYANTYVLTQIPVSNESQLNVSHNHTVQANSRYLGDAPHSTINFNNGIGKTASEILTCPTIFLDNNNTSNTFLEENFCLENYRLPYGEIYSYDSQLSVINNIGTFYSSSNLLDGDLLVYDGSLRYPTNALNGGNFDGSSIEYKIAGQPDYSGYTSQSIYQRAFRNNSNSIATFTIRIDFSNGTQVVDSLVGDTSNKVIISLKIPGKTGYRNIAIPAPSPGYDPMADGIGCLQGSKVTTSTSSTHTINLLTEGLLPNEYFVVGVAAANNWSGYINKITISGL